MTNPLHLIYVTGLGDSDPSGQRRAVRTWKLWGVTSELFQVNWADGEPWAPKLERLLKLIDDSKGAGKDVALVGASAGASEVINAYALRKDEVLGCVLIAGKVNRPQSVGSSYRTENPAFAESIEQCPASLAQLSEKYRQRIQSRYAIADETVYKPDSRIPGAVNRIIPIIGHVPAIATQIIFGVPTMVLFLRRLQRRLA